MSKKTLQIQFRVSDSVQPVLDAICAREPDAALSKHQAARVVFEFGHAILSGGNSIALRDDTSTDGRDHTRGARPTLRDGNDDEAALMVAISEALVEQSAGIAVAIEILRVVLLNVCDGPGREAARAFLLELGFNGASPEPRPKRGIVT